MVVDNELLYKVDVLGVDPGIPCHWGTDHFQVKLYFDIDNCSRHDVVWRTLDNVPMAERAVCDDKIILVICLWGGPIGPMDNSLL